VRRSFERYSTWSYRAHLDVLDFWRIDDLGDLDEPDSDEGHVRLGRALAQRSSESELLVVLGGDNAATWRALSSLRAGQPWGLITLDAHLDMREGRSNGSPVRQLLDEGLSGEHVVQIGLADFSNSTHYARAASAAGVTAITRDELRHDSVEAAVSRALAIAGAGGRPVYVDIDIDVADRSAVPGAPAAAPGGLSADEVRRFAYAVAQSSQVRAIDITEIDVARDSADERTVRLAALVVLEALAGRARNYL
jgi:formiminoglutamase